MIIQRRATALAWCQISLKISFYFADELDETKKEVENQTHATLEFKGTVSALPLNCCFITDL